MLLLHQHLKYTILLSFLSELKSDLIHVHCTSCLMDDSLKVKMHRVLQMMNSQLNSVQPEVLHGRGVPPQDTG